MVGQAGPQGNAEDQKQKVAETVRALIPAAGIEPATLSLGNPRSIQLSYAGGQFNVIGLRGQGQLGLNCALQFAIETIPKRMA